jgi:hypothetical protein
VAIFVEAEDLEGEQFQPVLDSYVDACGPAGSEAHTVEEAVSINSEVENLGSYISEYIGAFGDDALERPIHEQMFYATMWATNTRRVEFSNGAQELINMEQFRRETGLRPEDRGEALDRADGAASRDSDSGWTVERICYIEDGRREHADPTTGGVDAGPIDGRAGVDPPPDRG